MNQNKTMKKLIPWAVFAIFLVLLLVFVPNSQIPTNLESFSDVEIIAGQSQEIFVKPNQTSALSFVFDGSLLPGQEIPQNIQISALNCPKNVFLRVKCICQGAEFDFGVSEKFSYENDGYFYFDDVLNANEKVVFSKNFVISSNQKLESGKKYIVTVLVETLQEDLDVSEIWK